MTQSLMAQTKRPGVLAVHSLDEYVLEVPSLEDAKKFYTDFGLKVVDEGEQVALYAHNNPHRYATLIKGPKKRLLCLKFGIYAEDLKAFNEHIDRLGVNRVSPLQGHSKDSIWIESSDGFSVEIKVAEKSSPSAHAPRVFEPACSGSGRAPASSKVDKVHPLYMSHVLIFTKDVETSLKFYAEVLGLRLSDSSGEEKLGIAFMHSPHGSDHHLLAFLGDANYGFHHSSWTVESIDKVGLGMKQMDEAGHTYGWGVGRHVLGSNYFRYTRDPWGSYVEYSYDIDFVPHDHDWPSKNHPPQDSFYLWGPDVPAEFGKNFETH